MDRHAHKVRLRDLQVLKLIFAAMPWEGTAFCWLCHWHFDRNARELEELDSMDCEFVERCWETYETRSVPSTTLAGHNISCSTSAAFRRPGGFSTPTHSSTCLRVPRQYHHRCSLPSLAKPCPRNSMDKPQRWHFALRAFLRTDIYVANAILPHRICSVIACRSRTSISSFSNSMNVLIIIIDF